MPTIEPTPLSKMLIRLSQLPCVMMAPNQPPMVPPIRMPNQIINFMFLLYHEALGLSGFSVRLADGPIIVAEAANFTSNL